MSYRHKDLGTVIIQRWGSPPKVVPDFGARRQMRGLGESGNSWLREIAPLAAGVLLILVLERIELTSAPREVRRQAAELQAMALREPGAVVPETVHRLPDSR